MNINAFIFSGLLLSGFFFSTSYTVFDDVVTASTGYNESENGWFAWRSSYAEHEFLVDGDSFQAVLVDSGVIIHYPRLAAEIALWMVLGFGMTALIWSAIRLSGTRVRIEKGEQDVGGKGG